MLNASLHLADVQYTSFARIAHVITKKLIKGFIITAYSYTEQISASFTIINLVVLVSVRNDTKKQIIQKQQ